jgi:hypothetical protein
MGDGTGEETIEMRVMRMPNRYSCAAIVLTALLAGGARADKPGAISDNNAFRVAFGMSYYGFDICGDAANGQLYRKALTEKFDHCPFTAAAKADFQQWSAATDAKVTADIKRYIAEHDKLPESLDEKKMACRKEQATPAYQKTVALLAQYAKGEVAYYAVVPDPCDTKAGAP